MLVTGSANGMYNRGQTLSQLMKQHNAYIFQFAFNGGGIVVLRVNRPSLRSDKLSPEIAQFELNIIQLLSNCKWGNHNNAG